ncbi:LexA regulated protein [Marinomonas sp. C2222]|uniref:LexA regulated protein n=1 Tax=Marinomonas sargassi TaxID=2984494 RepID=A0ABT2YR64_9GAMM|nr:LexA regulated protein [Marinomonas sargassi]MCV2402382.1 LexA regulated protein [Marinomonas sargassi]
MAKSSADRNTIDLFNRTPGRPRTRALSRQEQVKLNKRAQREKEKAQGLKRLELKVDQEIIEKLDQLCELNDLKRAEWLSLQITKSFSKSSAKKLKK